MKKIINDPIVLPCLKGQIGDWYYYTTLMTFSEVAKRIKLPSEIDSYYKDNEDLKLGDWIQRKLEKNRTKNIVEYLNIQPQHFFNSLILGIYEGNPSWQDLNISTDKTYDTIDDTKLKYLSRTFGLLTLEGSEDIFAIDGQHRAIAIRDAVKENIKLGHDEISVIFVSHNTDNEGKIRTRRLFSTLNKYAKPVSPSEIIALSEDNNCAIITRHFTDNKSILKDKILVNKNKSISPENTKQFTNVLLLYDIIEVLLTDLIIVGIKTKGFNKTSFTTKRENDKVIKLSIIKVEKTFKEIFKSIPSLKIYIEGGEIYRKNKCTSLLFRPIGQNIFFNVLKVAIEKNKKRNALNFFTKDDFNLDHKVWGGIFWDENLGVINTEPSRQRFAIIFILQKIGVLLKLNAKDIEIKEKFNYSIEDI